MEYNIYFSKKKEAYYLTQDKLICANCEEPIKEATIIKRVFNKLFKLNNTFYYCLNCGKEQQDKIKSEYEESFLALITYNLPRDAFPVFLQKPLLTSHSSVFETALDYTDGAQIIDNTKHALKGSIEGAKIGHVTEDIKKLDEPFKTSADAKAAFENIINATPYTEKPEQLEADKKPLIENKE